MCDKGVESKTIKYQLLKVQKIEFGRRDGMTEIVFVVSGWVLGGELFLKRALHIFKLWIREEWEFEERGKSVVHWKNRGEWIHSMFENFTSNGKGTSFPCIRRGR